ncbi:DNA ligase [Streptomyces sp. SID8379]|uniref:ATP-dependent DNA ligase n=1 Tax=unclassified Streptomyces TaxID=2593676 RepID=UPI00131A438A|nr:RNA ligase family protein [Streptomyces sp. HmicA12]MYW67193.1 DNA ligase [Streptomyces sp. SID8379]
MEFPVPLALAAPIQAPPTGPYAAEWKIDGHRQAMWRTADTVILQARSGNNVTTARMDLAVAGMSLRPGPILDGEACIYVGERIDFSAAQSRAASTPARARELAAALPASYVAFDVISHPDLGDVRMRPWRERRALLDDLVSPLGPPIQVVPATEDRETADLWFEALADRGVEGLVWKLTSGRYEGGKRKWLKQRHTQTVDCAVVGFTGPAARPRHLVVRLPDERVVRSQALTGPLAAEIAAHLAAAGPGRRARTRDGETSGTGVLARASRTSTRAGGAPSSKSARPICVQSRPVTGPPPPARRRAGRWSSTSRPRPRPPAPAPTRPRRRSS